MNATELYKAGRLDDAIDALSSAVRDDPMDVRRRTFLFELLCFAGEYERAEKQLEVIARSSKEAELGAWVYRSALHAERERQRKFEENGLAAAGGPAPVAGRLNGRAFQSLLDADPRIGARLEVFAAGQYTWIPFAQISAIRMEPPKRLRDLLWSPAHIQVAASFKGLELGEVLLPVLAPRTWRNADAEVRLGRVTDWDELGDGTAVPVGQKLWLVDDEPFPILELRTLEIEQTAQPEA